MYWSCALITSLALLMCLAINTATGQAKQFTLRPSGPHNVATDVIPSSSVMSSVPSPSQRDEGIEYTLVEVEEIPVTPTPPLSKDNISVVSDDLFSSIPMLADTTRGPPTVNDNIDNWQIPTDANTVSSSALYYTPTVNDSSSLEPSILVSTAHPTSDVVTPPLQTTASHNTAETLTTQPVTTDVSYYAAASASNPCPSCTQLTSSSILSDQRQSHSSLPSPPEPSSGLHNPSITQPSSISPTPSSLVASSAVVSCTSPPCSSSLTEMAHTSLASSSTVFIPGNSNSFITTEDPGDDYESSNTPAADTILPDLSSSADEYPTFPTDKPTFISPHVDVDVTTESNIDITYNNTTAYSEYPESVSSNDSALNHHSDHTRIDLAVKFTASSIQRCTNRPTIEEASVFVIHSLKQLFDLRESHVFVSHPNCHCMTVNFLSVRREEGRKVEAMVTLHNIVFVMNFTVNGETHYLQLTGSSTVRFDANNIGGGADECRPPVHRKVPWRRLSRAEQIIVITVCTVGAMVVLAAFLFCLYEVRRRHTRKSFRLQSGTATMVRTEDYSLTKLNRPNTMYTDRGMIMEPIQADDVPIPSMYSSSTSLEKQPPGAHLANSPQKEWPLAPDPFPIRPSTSTENLVVAAARSRAGRRDKKIPGFDNPSFSSDDILASDNEENTDHTNPKDSHAAFPKINGIKQEAHVKNNLLRPICDSSRSESIT